MESKQILCTVNLANHVQTGNTRHFVHGSLKDKPDSLAITQFQGDSGYYLLHLDANGGEISDTYHETLNEAFDQAEWEFNVQRSEWTTSQEE